MNNLKLQDEWESSNSLALISFDEIRRRCHSLIETVIMAAMALHDGFIGGRDEGIAELVPPVDRVVIMVVPDFVPVRIDVLPLLHVH